MEGFVVLGMSLVILVITVIVIKVLDEKETERLHKEAEEKKKDHHRNLKNSLSLIYELINKDLSATFNSHDFYHYGDRRLSPHSYARIPELLDEGFIKIITLSHDNYDNNGIYNYTTSAQYQLTESGIAFLKRNYDAQLDYIVADLMEGPYGGKL